MKQNTCRALFWIITATMLYFQIGVVIAVNDILFLDSTYTDTVVIKDSGNYQHHSKSFHHSLAELLEIQEENKKDEENKHYLTGHFSSLSEKFNPNQFRLIKVAFVGAISKFLVDFQTLFCIFLI